MSITWIFLCPRFGQECLKILFLTRKRVLHGYFHVPVLRMFETTYCFSRINEYYMNISMYPFRLKNV